MAIGILGAGTGTTNGGLIYTVPAGISHAVVHVLLHSQGNGLAAATVSGPDGTGQWYVLTNDAGATVGDVRDTSTSLILGPNQKVYAVNGSGNVASVVVSGYEVT